MPNKINIGDLDNFLPYWVFDHLKEKSYMTDEVNQLSSSAKEDLLEESPLRDDFFVPKGDFEDTISPLEREFSTMTQEDLNLLRETYSFPAGIQVRIPDESETVLFTRPREIAFYEVDFSASLRLFVHPTIRRILNFYNICPA